MLTAEREQRGAIARQAPGSQTKTFTYKGAAALAQAAEQRILSGGAPRPRDVATLLHSMGGGTFPAAPPGKPKRWWSGREDAPTGDPLSVEGGHGLSLAEHIKATAETRVVAEQDATALTALV